MKKKKFVTIAKDVINLEIKALQSLEKLSLEFFNDKFDKSLSETMFFNIFSK